ncbi:hypothetical protein J2P12_05020 [Candidatus Bathyarchaeota archaeon]|nr:hypothetical protein [Candidatus Bathyarchaeota archaeon]
MASRQHPRRETALAGSREFRFYVSKAPEINRRFAGKHVAIVGDRIVASGTSPLDVWKRAKKSHPQSRPFLAYVPKRDTLVSRGHGVNSFLGLENETVDTLSQLYRLRVADAHHLPWRLQDSNSRTGMY